jgi:hypothetical protein
MRHCRPRLVAASAYRQPGGAVAAAPVQRFIVVVGEPADGGSAFRIEDPARLLRVWSLLRAASGQR